MRDNKTETDKSDKPTRCTVCGSPHVQYAIWYSPNTGETHDLFGSWNAGDNTYCATCDEEGRDPNPDLVDYEGDRAGYRKTEGKWNRRTAGMASKGDRDAR